MSEVSLSPAVVDLKGIRAGDRNAITCSATADGAPVDLTGATIQAQARVKATDEGDPAISAVVEITDAAAGQFLIRWPGADVMTLLAGASKWSGVWDMQYTRDEEDPVTIAAGKWEAVMDVTR